ncbi:eukaryotic translation initiation factor 3 subunit A-like [Brachionichthys hirsutus]|uniref:eukaryotic translation initiation factor 3 subunit A-like n=1 Tax=Brachionichthys hirsutus TaxID=412623 RepID=UPI003604F5AB
MPAYFKSPEVAFEMANEFLEVGKKQPALDVLYDVIKSKKHKKWLKIHEPIMLKYLELCVDLRKSHLAKEGLYQYKNICQQVNIKSLEDVVRAYLKLAEEKTETAKGESQQMVLDIEDLGNIQTPESVLLSAVSGEDTQDRTDRLLLTPWVKFLWESYRQCLDLLRNNSKVERLYHDIAQQAFKFCLQYTRKAEFRKLCDNLRMHLSQIQRHHNQSTAINLNNPESQSMHLETRLVQLDSAISMELWQEAFKAVEDIHGLFGLSKKPPKPQLMANYYNKVSTVFWKSGNALFHACTLHRLYHLSREMRKNLTQDEMQRMSTRVLLATLSIPITPERTDIARLLDMDGIIVDKHRRLATLLGLQSPPTRQSLINDMVRFNLLQYVVPDIKELYNWLEVDFHPLKLSGRVTKVLSWVTDQAEKEADLQQYVPHLQSNTILRLLQQVAQIYQSIEFTRLASLVPFVDAFQLERSIVDAARHCDLQVRIDHTSRTLSFGSDLNYSTKEDAPVGPFLQNMPSEQIRNQLTAMSSSLAKAIQVIKPASILQEREEQNQQAIAAYLKNARKDHQRILARRQTIEERNAHLENLNIQRKKEELEQKVRKAEEERLRQEAKEREKERIMQEHEQIKKTELGAKASNDIDIEEKIQDPDCQQGYWNVLKLAKALVEVRRRGLPQWLLNRIIRLWNLLPEQDKKRIDSPPRHQDSRLLGVKSERASRPSASRLVEAICSQLCGLHPVALQIVRSLPALILCDYEAIREAVLSNPRLMASTEIQLFELSQKTISQWYSLQQDRWEKHVLGQGAATVLAPEVSAQTLPPAKGLSFAKAEDGQVFDSGDAQEQPGPSWKSLPPPHDIAPAPAPGLLLGASDIVAPAAIMHSAPASQISVSGQRRVSKSKSTACGARQAAAGAAGGVVHKKKARQSTCSTGGRPRRSDTGHIHIAGVSYCAAAGGKPVEEWRKEMKEKQSGAQGED